MKTFCFYKIRKDKRWNKISCVFILKGKHFCNWSLIGRKRTWGTLSYLFVFSPNVGKYGPEKLEVRAIFTQCISFSISFLSTLNTLKLTLFRMGIFGAALGWGGGAKRPPLPKICHTYPTMMKLGIVISYLKKIQKICESHDTPSDFCWHQHFFTGNQQILLYQEIQI